MKKALDKKSGSTKPKSEEKVLEKALAKLPKNLANFVKSQIKLHTKKEKGRRYSPQMKSMAISLYHASGKAYRMLSKLFILPTKSSLRNYISKMPAAAGISQAALNIIRNKVAHMSEQEKLCTLCMDEISLKRHLYYDIRGDRIIGLEDFGRGSRTNKVATSALVFLARSISGKWKQPLGYALVNGGCPRDEMEELMKHAISSLEGIGLNIVVVMSDMGSNFQSLANHLQVTPEKPWFEYNNKKYFLMFDPPHLLKCVRNNLMKHVFKFGQLTATWKDIKDFYEKDKELTIRAAPKLTERHINPNNFCKMKVKYASQILSHTVAASLCTYVSIGGLPSAAMGTAEFVSKFDSVFDCVNSSKIHSPKKMKSAINEESSHISFLKEAITFIQELHVFEGDKEITNRIKCLKGWLVTLNAIILIWDDLSKNHNFKFLLTRRLNTDPLENFFGTIRQQGGNSDNPTPIQFIRAFRKLFFSSFLSSSTGNCADDYGSLLASQYTEKPDVPVLVTPSTQPPNLAIETTDYRENNVQANLLKDNPIAYVSGYLLHKCFKKHTSPTCTKALVSSNLEDDRNLLCFFKAYDSEEKIFGGLNAPSPLYLEYVKQLEDAFVADFSIYTKSDLVGKKLLSKLQTTPVPFQSCPDFPL